MAAEVLEGRRGIRPIKAQPAVCYNHRLAFSALGFPPFEPAFASLEPAEGDACHGVLYTVTQSEWQRICLTEGVLPIGPPLGYQTTRVLCAPYEGTATFSATPLKFVEGGDISALTLRFRQPQSFLGLPPVELPPSRRYLNLLRAGATEKALAVQWQAHLAALPSVF